MAVAFDDAGVGAFAAGWVEVAGPGELLGDPVGGVGDLVRGERPRCRWQSGGPGVGRGRS